MAGSARIVAADIDEAAGIAVIFVIASLLPWTPRLSCHCQYEFHAGQWHPRGSASTGADLGFPGQRPSAEQRGPALLLVRGAAGGGRVSDGSWIAYEMYRAAQEVSALEIDGRISTIPPHGYYAVTWRSSRYDGLASRPTVKAVGPGGEVLTEIRGGEYVDTASLAFIADDCEARGADD